MEKITLNKRIENALNALFDNDGTHGQARMMVRNDGRIVTVQSESAFTEKLDGLINAAKKMFLFIPGTLITFFAPLTLVFFYETIGVNFWTFFWILSGAFMVWAGLGDLRNKKHTLLPTSISVFSFILSAIFSLFPASMQPNLFFFYSIYFFPVALVIPHVVKPLIGAEQKN